MSRCLLNTGFFSKETEILNIRKYEEQDKKVFILLFTDEHVMIYAGDDMMSIKQAEAFQIKLFNVIYPQEYDIRAVFDETSHTYIGHTGIYPRPTKTEDWEFVYFLNPQSRKNGYATEIARRIIEFGFEELNLKEVFATVDDDHTA